MAKFNVCIAALIGCVMASTTSTRAENWDEVVNSARNEGQVVIYTTGLAAEFHEIIARSFTEKYGIEVNLLDLRASEIRERIRVEQTTGNQIADMIQFSPASLYEMTAEGSIDVLPPMPNDERILPSFERPETSAPSHGYGFGILVNTNLVAPEDRPESWLDLLDPKWRGKILSDDFRAAGGGQVFFEATYDAFGEEFHRNLAQQEIVFSRDLGSSERRVAIGEYPIRIPQHLVTFQALDGLPVDFITPSEGLVFIQFNSALLKGARHPNAARLLINHYLEPESQQVIAQSTLLSVIDTEEASDARVSVSNILGTTKPGYIDEMLRLAQEIYR